MSINIFLTGWAYFDNGKWLCSFSGNKLFLREAQAINSAQEEIEKESKEWARAAYSTIISDPVEDIMGYQNPFKAPDIIWAQSINIFQAIWITTQKEPPTPKPFATLYVKRLTIEMDPLEALAICQS